MVQLNPNSEIDYRRKWRVMVAVGSGVFLATIDSSIINVSLPTLVGALKTEFAIVEWVVLAYLLTLTTTMLSFGRVGDIFGKKRIYLFGYTIFLLGSTLCGLALSIYWLIAFRVIQAFGSAMVMALGAGILTEAFPPQERGKAMGFIGAIVAVGVAIGPAIGGLIIGTLSWRWIFYVNIPVGTIGSFMVVRNIPDYKPAVNQAFDYWGAITLFAGLLSLLLALTIGQREGFRQFPVMVLFCLSLVLMVLFYNLEKRLQHPMIDLQLFNNSGFSLNLATGFICFLSLAGVLILVPFYLENVLGYTTIQMGLLLVIIPVMLGVSSPLSGLWADRAGASPITVLGLLVLFVGYMVASGLSENTTSIGYMIRMSALGLGMGLFVSPNNSMIMGAAQRHQLGVVSSFMAITRTLGQTVGVAVMGAIWAGRAAYYAGLDGKGHEQLSLPIHAQVMALNDTFRSATLMISFALILSVGALIRAKKQKATTFKKVPRVPETYN